MANQNKLNKRLNDLFASLEEEIQHIQDPDLIIIIPENLALFLPKTTTYLLNFAPKHVEAKNYKKFKNKKLEKTYLKIKKKKLLSKKVAVGRTIKELRLLYENNDIDIDKFAELMEKYSLKEEIISREYEKVKNIINFSKSENKF